jgi:hypothetical protein
VRYILAALVTGLAWTAVAQAQPQIAPPPEVLVVHSVNRDKAAVQFVTEVTVPVQVTKSVPEEININGVKQIVLRPITETIMTKQTVMKVWSTSTNKACDITGKALAPDELLRRLKTGDAVLMVHGAKLDPLYQKLFNKDVIVLISGASPQ